MKRATLHLEVVTPCFLSGADQQKPEWRAASIRGQLRWWFRALAGAEFGGKLAPTRQAEEAVFGSTGRRSALRVIPGREPRPLDTGEPAFGRRVSAEQLAVLWGISGTHPHYQATVERLTVFNPRNRQKIVDTNPLQYLGYGCVGLRQLERPCIAPAQEVTFRLQWNTPGATALDETTERLFRDALWAWLHFGGLGSKARNGYGSLQLLRTEDGAGKANELFTPVATLAGLRNGVRDLLTKYVEKGPAPGKADWGQLGPGTTVHLGARPPSGWDQTWEEALLRAGAWLVAYRRRYGHSADLRVRNGAPVADRDYAWAAPRGNKPRHNLPDKAGFGLPLPFGERGNIATWWSEEEQKKGDQPKDHRRASPLHVHIAHVQEGYVPVLTHLPSQFLPDGAKLAYTGQKTPAQPPSPAQTGIIQDFLQDLATKKLVEELP